MKESISRELETFVGQTLFFIINIGCKQFVGQFLQNRHSVLFMGHKTCYNLLAMKNNKEMLAKTQKSIVFFAFPCYNIVINQLWEVTYGYKL